MTHGELDGDRRPGVESSDQFVKDGVLIADCRPGIADESGRLFNNATMSSLFGIEWKKELGRKMVVGEVRGEYKGVAFKTPASFEAYPAGRDTKRFSEDRHEGKDADVTTRGLFGVMCLALKFASLGRLVACLAPAVAGLLLGAATAHAAKTWQATGTNDWFDGANWSGSTYPVAGESVVITNPGAGVLLTNSTEVLSSLVLSNTATLVFSNWDTVLNATTVTIQNGATVTCGGPFTTNAISNRVYIVCTNLTIDAGGKIDVSTKGYDGALIGGVGQGPGGAKGRGGGAYGGLGSARACVTYGSASEPLAPGSGGGYYNNQGNPAGGAVRIQAADTITVNGTIVANGGYNVYGTYGGGGSGGGIYLTCRILAGTNGTISADGGYKSWGDFGGGGRIAVIYDTAAQGGAPLPTIRFSVLPYNYAASRSTSFYPGDIGTLYFPDNRFLSETLTTNFNGQWLSSGFTSWSPNHLVISNTWIRFPLSYFQMHVTNTVTIVGANARLDFGGDQLITPQTTYSFVGSANNALTVTCGDLVVTNGGRLFVYSGMTNAAMPTYGARVSVAGNMTLASNAWVVPVSHPTNGGSVLFQTKNLNIATTNAGFDASARGFLCSYGPGGVAVGLRVGGGYGGGGGGTSAGGTYGASNAPADTGSGGGGYGAVFASAGGGLVRIAASNLITINGAVIADGERGSYGGGGSGGGIYLSCRVFSGDSNGYLRANGNDNDYGNGSGGGGRIAVWCTYDQSAGFVSASVNGGTKAATGEVGTVFWGRIPPPGTLITLR